MSQQINTAGGASGPQDLLKRSQQLLMYTSTAVMCFVLLTGGIVGASMAAPMGVSDADTAQNQTTMGVQTFTVTDNSQPGYWWSEASLDIDWELTSEHTDVTVTVTNLDTGETVAEYSGPAGSETYTDYDAYGDQFEVKIEAGAISGGSLCKRYVGPADGTDNFQLEDCSSDGGEPAISTTSATVSADEIAVGESVDVTAELTNDGDAEGTHTAELTVDGDVVATQDVTLAAGESTTITFTESFETEGTYALAVDDVDAGTVTVEREMIEIRTDDISVNESEVTPDENFEITATLTNVGDRSGEVGIDFENKIVSTSAIGDDPTMPTVPQVSVQLDAGETKTVSMVTSYTETGTHEITPALHTNNPNAMFVANQSTSILLEESSSAINVTDARLSTSEIETGQSVETTATLENTGAADGTYTAELTVDGSTVATKDVTVGPGSTETVTFTRSFDTAGTYTLAVSNVDAGTLTVTKADESAITISEFAVSDNSESDGLGYTFDLGIEWGVEGDVAETTVTIKNLETGEILDEYTGQSNTRNYTGDARYDMPVAATLTATATDGTVVCTRFLGRLNGNADFTDHDCEATQANIEVTNTTLKDTKIPVTDEAGVSIELANTGDAFGTRTVKLRAGGSVVGTKNVSLLPNETTRIYMQAEFAEPGTYTLVVDETTIGEVTVESVPTVGVTETYQLLPANEDSITVTVSYDLSNINSTFRADAAWYDNDKVTVVSTNGLKVKNQDTVVWDNTTEQPSITMRRSVSRDSVDKWAKFNGIKHRVKTHPLRITERTGPPDVFVDDTPTYPEVFLGSYDLYSTTTDKQQFRILIPGVVNETDIGPEKMLEILTRTSKELDVGAYDDVVTGYILPTVDRANAGDNQMNLSPYEDASTIAHEYVHTRQVFNEEESAVWLTEATATFYGAQYAFRYEDLTYEFYRNYFPGPPVNLTDPEKYDTDGDNYRHGSDVVNALDSKIRQSTNNQKSFNDVFRQLNAKYDDGDLTNEKFKQLVEEIAGTEMDAFFERYVSGKNTPAFDRNPAKYEFTNTDTVSGTLSEKAATTGFVYTSTNGLEIDYQRLRNFEYRTKINDVHTFAQPESGGSWSLGVVTGLTDPIFDIPSDQYQYSAGYVQYIEDETRFPRDGVPDIHVLGQTDGGGSVGSLPSETHTVNINTVTSDGTPAEEISVGIGTSGSSERIWYSERTGSDGVFAPGGKAGMELHGNYSLRLNKQTNNGEFWPQSYSVTGTFAAEGDKKAQLVVYRNEQSGLTLHGTVVQANEITAGETTNISVLYYAPADKAGETETVPVYVDGEQVTTYEFTVAEGGESLRIPITLEQSGEHTVRVGDLPGQTVTVTGSDDGNDGDDSEPELANFEVIDQSYSGWYEDQAEFDISWEVTHEGNALDDVEVTVTNLDQSITRETYNGASGSQTYYDSGGYYNSEYNDRFRIRITAVDDNGDRICQEYVGPADGSSTNLERQSCSTDASQTAEDTTDDDAQSITDAGAESVSAVSSVGRPA